MLPYPTPTETWIKLNLTSLHAKLYLFNATHAKPMDRVMGYFEVVDLVLGALYRSDGLDTLHLSSNTPFEMGKELDVITGSDTLDRIRRLIEESRAVASCWVLGPKHVLESLAVADTVLGLITRERVEASNLNPTAKCNLGTITRLPSLGTVIHYEELKIEDVMLIGGAAEYIDSQIEGDVVLTPIDPYLVRLF